MTWLYWIGGAALTAAIAFVGFWAYIGATTETPEYAVVEQEGDFELRSYPELLYAEVVTQGDRGAAANAAFRPLARYIFARDRDGEDIAMTAPVTQTPAREKIAMTAPVTQEPADEGWRVRFIMPAGYTLDSLPDPANPNVRLGEIPPRRVAAVRFSGSWSDEKFQAQAERLSAWIAQKGWRAAGEPTYAYYNDPFTPGPLRRNEVMIVIAQ